MEKRDIFLATVLILFMGFISASFNVGTSSHSILGQYAPNDTLKGWINISLNNEPSDSLFQDSFGNSISLMKLLQLNNNTNFTCTPGDCNSDYSASNPQTTKTFTLPANGERVFGFNLTGSNFGSISSFTLNVSSNLGETTSPQLYIDVLGDNKAEWLQYKPSNNFYGESYGCYQNSTDTVFLSNDNYCEKINIPMAPNVEVGAYLINNSNSSINLNFQLCDLNYNCHTCTTSVSGTQRVSCLINQSINDGQDYYVCMSTQNSADNTKYKIYTETTNPCGYAGNINNSRDFKIFAEPGKYQNVGQVKLDDAEIQKAGINPVYLEDYIGSYLSKYNNDCSKGCIVPIKFVSDSQSQDITLSGADILYTIGGVTKQATNLYDLSEIPAKINSGFQKLYLDNANFTVTGNYDQKVDYILKLNGNEVFSDNFTIMRIPKIISINAQKVIAAYPTKFSVDAQGTSENSTISKYTWNFGDGSTISTTSTNSINHTYSTLGTFSLKVSVTDSQNLTASKTFTITVSTPKEAVNSVLKSKLNSLNNINSEIGNFPGFYKDSIKSVLDLDNVEKELSNLQQKNITATSDQDYVDIMNGLLEIKIPDSIFETENVDSIKVYPNKNQIDLNALKDIAGGDYSAGEEDKYLNAVVSWNFNNVETTLGKKGYSAIYGDSVVPLLNAFSLDIKKKQDGTTSYVIIPKLDNLQFKQNYNQIEKSNYYYIELSGQGDTNIEFSTTENISFSDLPVFISPAISDLSVTSNIPQSQAKISQQTLIVLVSLFVLFVGLIAYIILQEWYKRKYEAYLFKNRNDLYNIISYIESAKKRQMNPDDISSKLKEAGWTSEQVRYVMRKYAGKRTGMFEIPVEKIINKFGNNENSKNEERKFPPRRR